MNIKLLTRMAGPEGNHPPGSVVSYDEKKAAQMIKCGYAVAIDEPKIVEPQPKPPEPPPNRKLYENETPKKAVKKNARK